MGTVVVGAGMAGASVAYALRSRGLPVQVLDPLDVEGSATPASAGMLAPLYEADPAGPLLPLGLRARRQYPSFLEALERSSGASVPLHASGMLVRNGTRKEHERAERAVAQYLTLGCEAELLTVGEASRVEPGVGPAASYLRLADHAHLDVRALWSALPLALRAEGAELLRAAAEGIVSRGGTAKGVQLVDGRVLDADAVVIAAGAWSGRLRGLPRPVPVRPVRGQMIVFERAGGLSCLVADHAGRYLVPVAGDRVLAGSTMEDVGFDASLSDQGRRDIRRGIERLVPRLASRRAVEGWSGLRPVSADGLPLVGPDPEVKGLWYATGYGRGGILLSPLLGELLAAEMAGEPGDPDLAGVRASLRPARLIDPS